MSIDDFPLLSLDPLVGEGLSTVAEEDSSHSTIEEISRLRAYEDSLRQELLDIESSVGHRVLTAVIAGIIHFLQMRHSPRHELSSNSRDSDDEAVNESLGVFGEDKIHSLLDDMKVAVAAMTPGLGWKSDDKSDRGFTPMSLSKFFDQGSPDSNVDAFLDVLREARTKVAPISAQQPSRRLRPAPSTRPRGVEFYSSAFDEDIDESLNYSDDGKLLSRDHTPLTTSSHEIILSMDSLRRALELEDEDDMASVCDSEDIDINFFQKFKSDLVESTVSAEGINLALNKEVLIEAGLQEAREHTQIQKLHSLEETDVVLDGEKSSEPQDVDLFPARIYSNEFDERTRGDFSLWKDGSRLTWIALKQSYVGLFDSLLNTSNHYRCVSVMECVVRPDIELKRIMAVALRASHNLSCKFQLLKRSQALILASDVNGNFNQTHYRLATALSPSSISKSSLEWDVLEVQVCISRELKQRVLVGIFLKKTNSSITMISPKISTSSVSIHKMTNKMRKLLISSKLCLSSLYNVPPEKVCESGRLDGHFVAQVQTLFRESMWSSLHEAFVSMDEYAKQISRSAIIAQQSMEPIFKQHDIDMPSISEQRSDQISLTNTAMEEVMVDSVESPSKNPELTDIRFIDGMAKCLKIVTAHFEELQTRFDSEFISRLRRKHDSSFKLIDEMLTYRKELLLKIVKSPKAQSSALHRGYKLAMAGVIPTIKFTQPETDSRPSSIATAMSKNFMAKSWFSGISFQSTTQAEPIESVHDKSKLESSEQHGDRSDSSFSQESDGKGNNAASKGDQNVFFPIEEEAESSTSRYGSGGSFSSNDSTKINIPFKPTSELALSTVERVRGRLQAYKNYDDVPAEEYALTTAQKPLNRKEKVPDVVIYYSSCMVSKMPGTMYLTPFYLAFTSGWALAQYREMIPIIELDAVTIVLPNNAFIPSNTMKLTFFGGKKEIFVTPLAVDASRVRAVILDVINTFTKR